MKKLTLFIILFLVWIVAVFNSYGQQQLYGVTINTPLPTFPEQKLEITPRGDVNVYQYNNGIQSLMPVETWVPHPGGYTIYTVNQGIRELIPTKEVTINPNNTWNK
jgi:hypothetical protein